MHQMISINLIINSSSLRRKVITFTYLQPLMLPALILKCEHVCILSCMPDMMITISNKLYYMYLCTHINSVSLWIKLVIKIIRCINSNCIIIAVK